MHGALHRKHPIAVSKTPTTDGQSDMQHVSVCCLVLPLTVQVLLKVLDHVGSQPGSTAMFEDSLKNLRQVQFWSCQPWRCLVITAMFSCLLLPFFSCLTPVLPCPPILAPLHLAGLRAVYMLQCCIQYMLCKTFAAVHADAQHDELHSPFTRHTCCVSLTLCYAGVVAITVLNQRTLGG